MTKKKKKKKKGILDLPDEEIEEIADDLDLLDLDKKKKKAKKAVFLDEVGILNNNDFKRALLIKYLFKVSTKPDSEEREASSDRPWLDRDLEKEGFLYEELLDRVFKIIHFKNPSGAGATQKLYMPPPKLARIGTKKTCFTNFDTTARYLLSHH